MLQVPSNVFMTPVQKQLHEQLQRKANQVQTIILKQQEELKKIHQQLLFTQGPFPPDTGGMYGGYVVICRTG